MNLNRHNNQWGFRMGSGKTDYKKLRLELKSCVDAEWNLLNRFTLILGAGVLGACYLFLGTTESFFDSFNWLFFGVFPCALFLAFSYVEIGAEQIARVFRVGPLFRFTCSSMQWNDIGSVALRREKWRVTLLITTVQGRQFAFGVPSNTIGAARLCEAERLLREIETR